MVGCVLFDGGDTATVSRPRCRPAARCSLRVWPPRLRSSRGERPPGLLHARAAALGGWRPL